MEVFLFCVWLIGVPLCAGGFFIRLRSYWRDSFGSFDFGDSIINLVFAIVLGVIWPITVSLAAIAQQLADE